MLFAAKNDLCSKTRESPLHATGRGVPARSATTIEAMSETPALSPSQPDAGTKPDTPRIEAVLFDYGQVLSQGPNAAAWERLRNTVGGTPEAFHDAYWKPRHGYDRGDLNGTSYWHIVARAVGHPGLTEAQLDALYQDDVALWTDLNEPMVAWAKSLHQRGIRTGILSNIGDRMEAGIRKTFDWIGAFHHCTWSHRLTLAKPELEIYQHAAKGLETPPAHILFIDDREENITAARAVGMEAIRYTTHSAFVEDMRRAGLEWLLSEPA